MAKDIVSILKSNHGKVRKSKNIWVFCDDEVFEVDESNIERCFKDHNCDWKEIVSDFLSYYSISAYDLLNDGCTMDTIAKDILQAIDEGNHHSYSRWEEWYGGYLCKIDENVARRYLDSGTSDSFLDFVESLEQISKSMAKSESVADIMIPYGEDGTYDIEFTSGELSHFKSNRLHIEFADDGDITTILESTDWNDRDERAPGKTYSDESTWRMDDDHNVEIEGIIRNEDWEEYPYTIKIFLW